MQITQVFNGAGLVADSTGIEITGGRDGATFRNLTADMAGGLATFGERDFTLANGTLLVSTEETGTITIDAGAGTATLTGSQPGHDFTH